MKILCVEDDEGLAVLLQQTLVKQHYQVELATDGLMGWNLAEVDAYDLILLDWMLPNFTGIEFCQRLRTEKQPVFNPNRDTPVLLMTALDSITNKIMGLNAGADDYVVKPFDLEELLARIRALLRRNHSDRSPLLRWGKLCLNPNSCEVTYQGKLIGLAAKEHELLELFLRHPDQIFSLNRLLTALWSLEEMPGEGAVRTHIKSLRQKLKKAGSDDPIDTVYKLGYRLKHWGTKEQDEEIEQAEEQEEDEREQLPFPSFIPSELWEIWQEVRQIYCDRLSIIQQAVVALQSQTLTLEQQQLAEQEAHTLAGSLGSFGLDQASQLSRQIQQILQQSHSLDQTDAAKLLPLIDALSQQLRNFEGEKTAAIDALKTLSNPVLLIVDDDLSWVKRLVDKALTWGWQAKIVRTFTEAQHFLQSSVADVMLLTLDNFDATKHGLEFLTTVRFQNPKLTIVTLATEASFERRIAAARLGSRCFLKKPIAPAYALAAIVSVLNLPNSSPPRILIVDSDPKLLQYVSHLLESEGYQVTSLCQPEQFWQTLEQTNPDLLILEVDLYHSSQLYSGSATHPPFNGIELCQVIRIDPNWHGLPIMFLSVPRDSATVQSCFDVGADDFLNKPIVTQDFLIRVKNRLDQRKRWNLLSKHSQEI